MTEKQRRRLYFPLWQSACKANAWRVQDGCLVNAAPAEGQSEWVYNALALAGKFGAREHRAATLDDLRYAVHYICAGRNCGSGDLRNGELTRVCLYFRLLADADDLDAVNRWFHPEIDERDGLLAKIRGCPSAYVRPIVRDRFGASDWEGLGVLELRHLWGILRKRSPFSKSPRGLPTHPAPTIPS